MSERKQHFLQHKRKHGSSKEAYMDGSKSAGRKVGYAAVFTDTTKRSLYSHIWNVSNKNRFERDKRKCQFCSSELTLWYYFPAGNIWGILLIWSFDWRAADVRCLTRLNDVFLTFFSVLWRYKIKVKILCSLVRCSFFRVSQSWCINDKFNWWRCTAKNWLLIKFR